MVLRRGGLPSRRLRFPGCSLMFRSLRHVVTADQIRVDSARCSSRCFNGLLKPVNNLMQMIAFVLANASNPFARIHHVLSPGWNVLLLIIGAFDLQHLLLVLFDSRRRVLRADFELWLQGVP
ncbi:hypothetical protein HPP92_009265 [Vanilla planifolia]|uniref:Uncharacterized protein n=1 Tax=Vanilla planifolia TaxID=51239 RepID=A0A835V6S9_VANPL|nr:hypothetical protein HPP92_009265 [Vanilla planifolia]